MKSKVGCTDSVRNSVNARGVRQVLRPFLRSLRIAGSHLPYLVPNLIVPLAAHPPPLQRAYDDPHGENHLVAEIEERLKASVHGRDFVAHAEEEDDQAEGVDGEAARRVKSKTTS